MSRGVLTDEVKALSVEDYWMCADMIREEIKAMAEMVNISDDIDKLIDNRLSNGFVRVINRIWFALPDRLETRSIWGFIDMCDLCSEAWVLNEEHKDD